MFVRLVYEWIRINTVDFRRLRVHGTELETRFVEVFDLARVRIVEGKKCTNRIKESREIVCIRIYDTITFIYIHI